MSNISQWWQKRLADTELVMLLVSLLVIFILLMLLGSILTPVLLGIALAYVLDGVVDLFTRCKFPRMLAIAITGGGVFYFSLVYISYQTLV